MHKNEDGKTEYNILPLDSARMEEWNTLFDLDESTMEDAHDSYIRTMEIVGAGIEKVEGYLSQEKTEREEYYLDLAMAA